MHSVSAPASSSRPICGTLRWAAAMMRAVRRCGGGEPFTTSGLGLADKKLPRDSMVPRAASCCSSRIRPSTSPAVDAVCEACEPVAARGTAAASAAALSAPPVWRFLGEYCTSERGCCCTAW